MKRLIPVWVLFTVSLFSKAQNGATFFYSPDWKIVFTAAIENDKLFYSVAFNKVVVIEKSALGLVINGFTLGDKVAVGTIKEKQVREEYPYRGVHNKAVNNYNSVVISFKSYFPFSLEVRVFNDGVAFRYITNSKGAAGVEKDITEFVLPAGSVVWSQPNVKYYEGKYGSKLIDTVKQGELMGPPVTIELPGNAGYAAITEGGLTDFAGMSLIADGNRGLLANLSGKVSGLAAMESPWRIIEIGKDLNTLVNCDIIANVSPPYDKKLFPQGYNTSWVKPGRSVWSWLAKTRSVTLENMKHFSDLAAELGFEYNLVDEGWSDWKDSVNNRDQWQMMKELVDYSAAKGVKIWIWKAYPDRKGIPGIKDPEQRKTFFKKCKELGIAGLKVDFFDSESQEITRFYQAALKDAAEYELMMNFHGANKPTGESRTWPNEMTREAIRGMENQPPWAPSNTILPFTRYLAGHADYTPVHFGNRTGEVSWAHHVASMIVFASPFLCLGADPQSILDNPCKDMIQSIPTTWDETLVLPQSKIGELVLYARRKENTWFLAAMSSSKEPRTIDVDCSFLKGSYALSAVLDDSSKQNNALLETTQPNSSSVVSIKMNANGGYAGRFDKIKK
ncbi:MAG: glycoside hydrolase family 97 catalytic domain-containing protein [Bacteroidota bacterium]